MIKQEVVTLTFPMGANFVGNVQIDIYRRLISFIKELMCFNLDSKCDDCCKNKQCRYYSMTGGNFSKYPGILIKNDLFEKKHYIENEQIKLVFYFIGNNDIYKDYIQLFFEQLNQNLFGNFFYLNSIDIKDIHMEYKTASEYSITTPIESLDFNQSYNQMVLYYNEKYDTNFLLLENNVEAFKNRTIQWTPIRLRTKTIKVIGYIYSFKTEEEINQCLLITGIGKFNYLGGGHIEIKT